VTTERQIIVAAEIAPDGLDFAQLDRMVSAAERELAETGVTGRPEVALADAGYWSNEHIDRLRKRGGTPLIAADADRGKGPRKTWLGGPYDFICAGSFKATAEPSSTHGDSGWSSRCSPRSSRTAAPGDSDAEAGRPFARNGA
jgi:hypothetical protein